MLNAYQIVEFKQKYNINFKMNKTINFDYLIRLSDIYSEEIVSILKSKKAQSPSDFQMNKKDVEFLFNNLQEIVL
jgi:hypothetical protein